MFSGKSIRILKRFLVTLGAMLWGVGLAAELPLKSDATLEMSTSTVTWLSFDLSPDGQTFVLEVLGDLYTLPVEGGLAAPLATGLPFDSQPMYSPVGNRIAFISDRSGHENVWVMDADGSSRALSDTPKDSELMSPSWSPDGSHVIVSVGDWKTRTYRVWAYHLDGGKGVRLAPRRSGSSVESHNHVGAIYSPDARYLYYAFKEGGFGYNVTLPLWQVQRLELTTNERVELTAAVGSAFRPALSPDGTKLVYGTRFDTKTGLRIRDLPSGRDEWLVYPVQRDEQESRYTRDLLPKPVFAPDSNTVYYTSEGKLHGIRLTTRELFNVPFEIPLKLERVERLEFQHRIGLGPVKAQLIRGIELSPNGTKAAFSALAQIYMYEFASKEFHALTPPNMFVAHPVWSPDGRQIAFVSWSEQGGHIWRVRARKNAKPVRVTTVPGHYFDPLWRKDGQTIIALRASAYERANRASDWGQGIGTDLVQVALAHGETSLIAHAPNLYDPHYGPEIDRIYLYEWPGLFTAGDAGLYSIRLDGTDRRKHVDVSGPGIYNTKTTLPASRIRISPNGRHVLVKQANQLYALKLLGSHAPPIKTRVTECSLPCTRLTDVGVDEFAWDSTGETAVWSVGHTIKSRPVVSLFEGEKSKDSDQTSSDEETTKPLAEEHVSVESHLVEIYAPRFEPKGSVVLRNATLLPVKSDQPSPLSRTDLHISGGRIEAIGPDLTLPEGSTELDLSGKFIVPGFIDTHAHFPIYRGTVSGEAWALLANLAYGVTTAIDVQPSTVDVIEYRNLADAGRIVAPRVLSTGPGVFRDTSFKSTRDALGVLRRYKTHYGVRNIKSYLPGNREQRHWLIAAARELEMNPTTEGALDMKVDITHVLDGFTGLEHNLPVVGIYDDMIALMAEAQIAYTPTLLVSYGGPFGENHFFVHENPRGDAKLARFTPPSELERKLLRRPWAHLDTHVFVQHAQSAYDIVKAGGRVGVGSHGQLNGLGFHWELWALHMGGFSNFEALRAATRHGAAMLGIDEDLGSIEVGKLADLVVLNSNPYDDIRATNDIHLVILGGFIRRADDLAEIWPTMSEPVTPQFETIP